MQQIPHGDIARQNDFCQVCGAHTLRKDLVRTQVKYKSPAGQNYCTYSSYDTSLWSSDDALTGNYAPGPTTGNYARVRVGDDNTLTAIDGSATFTGTGSNNEIKTTTAIDITGWTNLTVSAFVGPFGPYDQTTTPAQTVTYTLKVQDATGTKSVTLVTGTTLNQLRIWGTASAATVRSTLGSSDVYISLNLSMATGGYYYYDCVMVEKDVTTPGDALITTNGSAIAEGTTDSTRMTVLKVCRDCREPLHRVSELRGKPRRAVEPPVYVDMQEL